MERMPWSAGVLEYWKRGEIPKVIRIEVRRKAMERQTP